MIHFHIHSHYSKRDGYQTIDEIVERAKELNMLSIGLSDHGTSSGLIDFYFKCKENNIRPIFCIEMYYTPSYLIKDRSLTYHLLVIAYNTKGYHNLLKLNSIAHSEDHYYYKPRISMDDLKKYSEGLIITSACRGGILKVNNALDVAKEFKQIFGDRFYIEIQPEPCDEQKEYNFKVIDIAKQLNIPLICQSDAHYCKQEHAYYHKLWLDGDEYYNTDSFYIMDEADISQRLKQLDVPEDIIQEAIDNTHVIANMCDVNPILPGNHYPTYDTKDPYEEIVRICRLNWKEKLANVPKSEWDTYAKRFHEEMEILQKADYLNYLLIVYDVMNFCKEQGIYVGYGRGSVAGCLVAYLLNITKVNPLPHRLVFQRFCHLERVSPADCDLDIEPERKDEVINFLRSKYGEVLPVRTTSTLSDRGAVKRSGQALKMNPQELNALSTSIEKIDEIKGHEQLVDVAKHFLGRITSFSQHACASMIYQEPPDNFTSIEKQGDAYVSAYEFGLQEKMGLLKLDLLSLDTMSIVKNALKLIGEDIDIYNLPLDDPEVYEMLSKGHTSFCFQIESMGMSSFCQQIKPSKFSDIVAILSLYRPGCLNSGLAQQFIDRKNGAEFEYLHPILEEVLSDSYGVYIFQEDLMRLVQRMANMTLGQADMFRRGIGKKDEELLKSLIPEFVDKCATNGIERSIAQEVADNILKCADYLFSRNHACAYAHLTYLTAWLKCKYPLPFICACLNSKIDDQEKTVEYVNEIKKLGFKVLPPDINLKNKQWTIHNDGFVVGLNFIKGIGSNIDLSDVSTYEAIRSNNNKRIVEALIKSGSLDSLGERKTLLTKLYGIKENTQAINLKIKTCEDKIVELESTIASTKNKETKKYQTMAEQLENRKKDLKKLHKKLLEVQSDEQSLEKYDEVAGEFDVLGMSFKSVPMVKEGVITRIFTKNDKKDRPMAFLTFNSKYGEIKTVVFASDYKKWKKIIRQDGKYMFIEEKGILKELREVV